MNRQTIELVERYNLSKDRISGTIKLGMYFSEGSNFILLKGLNYYIGGQIYYIGGQNYYIGGQIFYRVGSNLLHRGQIIT